MFYDLFLETDVFFGCRGFLLKKKQNKSVTQVPVLVATLGPGQHQQLNDSSVIISTLYSYLIDGQRDLLRNVKCYPTMEFHDDDGKRRTDIMNRYFIMFGDTEPDRPKASLASVALPSSLPSFTQSIPVFSVSFLDWHLRLSDEPSVGRIGSGLPSFTQFSWLCSFKLV